MRTSSLIAIAVLGALACKPPPRGPLDRASGPPIVDAGPTAVAVIDAAPLPVDAAPIAIDAGASTVRVVVPTVDAGSNQGQCPARYRDIPAGQVCGTNPGLARPTTTADATGAQCRYPEGQCYCGVESVCSGMMMTPEENARLRVIWQCTPTPPAIRPDGCPGSEPSGPCRREGQRCSYGTCCFHELTCQSGRWNYTGGGCPP